MQTTIQIRAVFQTSQLPKPFSFHRALDGPKKSSASQESSKEKPAKNFKVKRFFVVPEISDFIEKTKSNG